MLYGFLSAKITAQVGKMKSLCILLLHFMLATTLALATDQVVFNIIDRIQFSVPGHWPVIASKSSPEKTVFAFQIPNPADEGTSDSTNLVITSSSLKDAKDREAFDKRAATSEGAAVGKSLVDGWRCRSFTAIQDKTQYVVWDCYREMADCGIFVRLAWPHLPKNSTDHDKQMEDLLSDFLRGVGPAKKSHK